MQKNWFFWLNWPITDKILFYAFASIIALLCGAMFYFQYHDLQNIVAWNVLSELDEVPVVLDQLNGQALVGKAFVLKEQFVTSVAQIPNWLSATYTIIMGLGLALILAAISGLKRFHYLMAMTTVVLLLASFQLEILQSLGGKFVFLAWVIILGGITYYWNNFATSIQMPTRIGIMAVTMAALIGLTLYFAKSHLPIFTFSTFSILGNIVLGIIFICWLSIEIIAGFVYITTNARTGFGKNSLYNFLFISILYLLSILLIYLKNTKRIEGDFWLFSPFVWLLVSIWLGFWSLEKRADTVAPLRHISVWLYAGMAILLLNLLCFAWFTANSPLVEALEDAFVYSQLGMGLVFVVYVGLNFWPIFKAGKEVHKIIYRPMRFMQSQAWIVGIMASVALAAADSFLSVQQAWGGYQNAIGDLYTATGEYRLAEQYYKNGLEQDFLNRKSNYSLASLAVKQNDFATAGAYFQESLSKNPSVQAYAALGNVMLQENLIFDAIFNLRKGIRAFPESAELHNNLGYLFLKTNILDSALYYFDKAKNLAPSSGVAAANILAVMAKNPKLDIDYTKENIDYSSYQANMLALKMARNEKIIPQKIKLDLPPDSALSTNHLALIYNAAESQSDTTLAHLTQKLLNNGQNGACYDELQMATAYAHYANNKLAAFDMIATQTYADTSKKTALAQQTLRFWFLKEATQDAQTQWPAAFANEKEAVNFLKKHPLSEIALAKATAFWNSKNQKQRAYDAILATLRFRKDSPEVHKLYVKQCLMLNYTEFANDSYEELKKLLPPNEYQQFRAECDKLKANFEQRF